MGDASRKKNIGFKAKGKDANHDRAFSILDSLPRGMISDFVVIAVTEYLDNHAGEIAIANRRKVVIVRADTPAVVNEIQVGNTEPKQVNNDTAASDSDDTPIPALADESGVSDAQDGEGEDIAWTPDTIPESPVATQEETYPNIDDNTLAQLISSWNK